MNARKHGLYASELLIDDEDRSHFEGIRRDLFSQLQAATALEEIARERVIACAWRAKLALRLESRELRDNFPAMMNPSGGPPAG